MGRQIKGEDNPSKRNGKCEGPVAEINWANSRKEAWLTKACSAAMYGNFFTNNWGLGETQREV